MQPTLEGNRWRGTTQARVFTADAESIHGRAAGCDMTGFESLTLALEGWFEKPLSDLPDGLRERVENEDLLKLWDSLSANQRRSAALQLDYVMDPARAEERDAAWNEVSVDWDYWKQVPALTAQEFCILCLLHDPRGFESEKTFTFGGAGKALGELVDDDVRIIERTLGPDITRPIPEWIAWAKLQNWDMPSYFRDYEKSGGAIVAASNRPSNSGHDEKPWLIKHPDDPAPNYPWFTPARFFARVHIKEDVTLLNKRDILATKVADSLKKVDIMKRGGKKPLDPATVKKAFSNVKLG